MDDFLYTLRDLVEDPELRLRLVSEDEGGLERSVDSGQILYDLDPTMVRQNELVMVPDAAEGKAVDAAAFVAEIVSRGAGAFVCASPVGESGWLREAVSEALARGLPVLEVIAGTRFGDVIRRIDRSTESPDRPRFQRLVTMQNFLVDALHSDDQVQEIVNRLAKVCKASVGMTKSGGIVEASSGVLPFVLFGEEIARSRGPAVELDSAGWSGLALRISDSVAMSQRWLVVASRRARFPDEFVRLAASIAASLVQASGRIELLSINQDRAVRSALLHQALELRPHDNTTDIAGRAAALGLTFTQEVRVLVVSDRVRGKRGSADVSLSDRLYRAFDDRSFVIMVTERDGEAVALIQGQRLQTAETVKRFAHADSSLVIGVGRPTGHIGAVPTSHHDAVLAAQQARSAGNGVFSYDDFEFTTRLLAHVGSEQMSQWSREVLSALDAKPILMEALLSYFSHDFDIMAAAEALHVHHNSLRYRLNKVEELVGGSLKTPSIISALYLAIVSRPAVQSDARAVKPVKPGRQRKADSRIDIAAVDSPTADFIPNTGERSLGATLPRDH